MKLDLTLHHCIDVKKLIQFIISSLSLYFNLNSLKLSKKAEKNWTSMEKTEKVIHDLVTHDLHVSLTFQNKLCCRYCRTIKRPRTMQSF